MSVKDIDIDELYYGNIIDRLSSALYHFFFLNNPTLIETSDSLTPHTYYYLSITKNYIKYINKKRERNFFSKSFTPAHML